MDKILKKLFLLSNIFVNGGKKNPHEIIKQNIKIEKKITKLKNKVIKNFEKLSNSNLSLEDLKYMSINSLEILVNKYNNKNLLTNHFFSKILISKGENKKLKKYEILESIYDEMSFLIMALNETNLKNNLNKYNVIFKKILEIDLNKVENLIFLLDNLNENPLQDHFIILNKNLSENNINMKNIEIIVSSENKSNKIISNINNNHL